MESIFLLIFILLALINFYYLMIFLIMYYLIKKIITRKIQLRLYLGNSIIHYVVDCLTLIENSYQKNKKLLKIKVLKLILCQMSKIIESDNDEYSKEKIKNILVKHNK